MPGIDYELKEILDKLEDVRQREKETRKRTVSEQDAWVTKFDERRKKVIRPTLEELGEQVRKRGHDFYIIETNFRKDNRAIPLESSIRIDLYLSNERTRTNVGLDRRPSLGFSTKHVAQVVEVTICDITAAGGTVSKMGEYPLEVVDAGFVRDRLVALFNRLLKIP